MAGNHASSKDWHSILAISLHNSVPEGKKDACPFPRFVSIQYLWWPLLVGFCDAGTGIPALIGGVAALRALELFVHIAPLSTVLWKQLSRRLLKKANPEHDASLFRS
jgi:uncharacterized metal-binding protein